MDGPSNEMLIEVQMAEYAMRFVPWERQITEDGAIIYFNSKTHVFTEHPDPEFIELQDRLDAALNAVKEAEKTQTRNAKDAFEEWLRNHHEIQSTSRFSICEELCESFGFWPLISLEERVEIFYKFTNSSAQYKIERMNTDMKLLEDKVEYLQFQSEYFKDQNQKFTDLVYHSELKQKQFLKEIEDLTYQLKKKNEMVKYFENKNECFQQKLQEFSDLKEEYSRSFEEKDQKIINLQSQIVGLLEKTKDISDLKEYHSLCLEKSNQTIIDLQNCLIQFQDNISNLRDHNEMKENKITELNNLMNIESQKLEDKEREENEQKNIDLKSQFDDFKSQSESILFEKSQQIINLESQKDSLTKEYSGSLTDQEQTIDHPKNQEKDVKTQAVLSLGEKAPMISDLKLKLQSFRDKYMNVCVFCGVKYKKLQSLRMHMRQHNTQHLWECIHCNQTFNKPDLYSHLIKLGCNETVAYLFVD